ncbi:MAG: hypothetical protein H6555_09800 [Lewinellaceae bacterium]|nr:hypothetical protein [Lewinellaceae bacterium]
MKHTALRFFYFASMVLVFASCSNTEKVQESAQDQLRDQVMAIHDEVMPKIADINRATLEFKKAIAVDSTLEDTLRERVAKSILQLEAADEGMMSWMSTFRQPASLRETQSHEAIMAYLQEQLTAVKEVEENMLQSLKEADEIRSLLSAANQ